MNDPQVTSTDTRVISDIVPHAPTPPISKPPAPANQPPSHNNAAVNVQDASDGTLQPAVTDNSTLVTEQSFDATDNIPDAAQQLSTATTNTMQTPRIYDTKEYFVPIHETTHSHGVFGTVVAGIVSALIVLAIVVVLAYLVQ